MSDRVSTGCGPVDELLGGGFERGAVTQIYGPPAAGKTNLCLSAALAGAVDGRATLYVDTEGISPARVEQIAAGHRDAAGVDVDVETLADCVIVAAAHDFEEQREAVQDAADVASQVDLIVLDSATGFYRLERTKRDEGEALRAVGRQLTHLVSLARKHDLAVAATNQVFTDPEDDRARALGGHTLNHWSAAILRLERFRGGKRRATLEKHRSEPAGESAQFAITDAGLVDPER